MKTLFLSLYYESAFLIHVAHKCSAFDLDLLKRFQLVISALIALRTASRQGVVFVIL